MIRRLLVRVLLATAVVAAAMAVWSRDEIARYRDLSRM